MTGRTADTLPFTLVDNAYGKSRVRMTRVTRHPDRHDLKEMQVDIELRGKFEHAYLTGDNKGVVATDSMKNTVYALAARYGCPTIEEFGKRLAEHFLEKYPQVEGARVNLTEHLWERIPYEGKPHRHSFMGSSEETRVSRIEMTRRSFRLHSGLDNLLVLKTTDSEFWGFVRDEFTTLAEVHDRIFATNITAIWEYAGTQEVDFDDVYGRLRRRILDVFVTHRSLSVQQTLYAMGEACLAETETISEIAITMPNQHRIPFNLAPFGQENRNEIFVPTDEPHGLISGTIRRR